MSNIIPDIRRMKEVVRIANNTPFEAIEPFINDAADIYLIPNIGAGIYELAEQGTDVDLVNKVRRALGPLAMALAIGELSVLIGDGGLTVQNEQGKRSPANEAKIAAAKENLFKRGMYALDRLLEYLRKNIENYPDYAAWLENVEDIGCIITSADDYQDSGGVDIGRSALTYRTLLPSLKQLQETELLALLPESVQEILFKSKEDCDVAELRVQLLAKRFLANRCAEIYSSQTSRQQRGDIGTHPEFQPLFRPLYTDLSDTGNWYGRQATYYKSSLLAYIEGHPEIFDIDPAAPMNYNGKDKKIFTSLA